MIASIINTLQEEGRVPTMNEVASRLMRANRERFPERGHAMREIAFAIKRGEVESGDNVLKLRNSFAASLIGSHPHVNASSSVSRVSSIESVASHKSSSSLSSSSASCKSLTSLLNPPAAKRPAYLDARLPTPPYCKIQRKAKREEDIKRHHLQLEGSEVIGDDEDDEDEEKQQQQQQQHKRVNNSTENKRENAVVLGDGVEQQPPVRLDLSPEAERILELVHEKKSVFYTGAAGTGKSFLLREIIRQVGWRWTANWRM